MSETTINQFFYGYDNNMQPGENKKCWPFFEMLWKMQFPNSANSNWLYTDELGNPISVWLNDPSFEYVEYDPAEYNTYKGIAFYELDALYKARSGNKLITSFAGGYNVSSLANAHNRRFSDLVYYVTRLYSKKWFDLWETMFYEFDPIENYNMLEQLRDDVKTFEHGKREQITNDLTHSGSGENIFTPATSVTETDKIYGFNSTTGQNANQRTTTQGGTDATVYETTEHDTGTSTTVNSGTDEETHEYTLTRSGNIGVTTSQQMIEQQRKLLMFDYFDEVVFPDIDKIITIKVY